MTLISGLVKCSGISPEAIGALSGASLGTLLAARNMSDHISPFATAEDARNQKILSILLGAAVGGGLGGISGKSAKELISSIKEKTKDDSEQTT